MAAGHPEIMTMIEEETAIFTADRTMVLPAEDEGITVMTFEDILREDFLLVFLGFSNLLLTLGLRNNALLH